MASDSLALACSLAYALVASGSFALALVASGSFALALVASGSFALALVASGSFALALVASGSFALALVASGSFALALVASGSFALALVASSQVCFRSSSLCCNCSSHVIALGLATVTYFAFIVLPLQFLFVFFTIVNNFFFLHSSHSTTLNGD